MFADGSLGVRRIWWLLQCSHLMVPLCLVVCPVGARLTVCGAALCPVVLLLAFLPVSGPPSPQLLLGAQTAPPPSKPFPLPLDIDSRQRLKWTVPFNGADHNSAGGSVRIACPSG